VVRPVYPENRPFLMWSLGSPVFSSGSCPLNTSIECGTCSSTKVCLFRIFVFHYLNSLHSLGIPFLIRVGLGLFYCCRRQILEATTEESLLSYIQRPFPNSLPPTSDGFISLVNSLKLKDDDIRKQRVKMEAQVKRQTQNPRMTSTPGTISLPRV
jgi:hypothetical protein